MPLKDAVRDCHDHNHGLFPQGTITKLIKNHARLYLALQGFNFILAELHEPVSPHSPTRRRESLKRGAQLSLMNTWIVPTNAASQGQRRGLWLWLHIKEQHCLSNSSLLPTPSYANKSVQNVASWCTWSQKWFGWKKFFFRFLSSPPRSAPWSILPHSCVNSWLWQSTGREVGWAPMSRGGEPGLFKLSLPSGKCSKNHSPSCMKSKSTGLDCQLLSVCMKNLYKIGRPLHTSMRLALICLFCGGCSQCFGSCWLFNIMLLDTIQK